MEGVVNTIDTHSQTNDRIFVAENSPGLYVLADRQVWGDAPWPLSESAASMAQAFAAASTPPKLFILERRDVFGSDWPGGLSKEPNEQLLGEKKTTGRTIWNTFACMDIYGFTRTACGLFFAAQRTSPNCLLSKRFDPCLRMFRA